MKTKPTRHKETNTFKFKPFSERVNDIDVDVFHKVAHRNEVVTAEETETFFYQCIQKWNFLNLSQSYSNFRKEVADIITLPQLLNRKQHVVDTLLKYLKLKDPLCLQTIFDLVIALAKDLEIDFYEYFPEFLTIIIDLLQIRDAEQLENTFHTLAYLFKFQWRYMIKNIDTIFNLLVPLLADTRPPYVNNFAAESFAFVVRKVKDKEAFLRLVLDALEQKPDGVVGCGKLLFHVLAGIPGQFHSCAENMLNIYLSALRDSSIKQQQLLFEVLSTVFKCISSEIHPQKCDVLWTVIFESLDKFSSSSLIFLLRLVQILINHKGGVILKDYVLLSKKFAELIDKYEANEELLEEATNATVATLLASNVKLLQETSSFLIFKLLSIDNLNLLLKITEKLIVYSSFETLVLPQLFKKSSFSTLDGKLLGLLAKIVYAKSPPCLSGIGFENWSKFGLNVRNNAHNVTFLSQLLDSLQQSEGEVKEDALKALIILPHLTLSLQEQLRENLNECLSSLYKRVLEKKEHQSKINFAFLLAIECVARLTKPDDFYTVINSQSDANLLSAVVLHDNDVSILNALDICFSYLKNSSYAEEYINQKIFDILHNLLVSKLGSPNSQIRLTISHLFSLFTGVPALTHESEDLKVCNAIELPFLAESEQVTVHKYRSRLVHIQPLDFHGASVSHLNSNYYDLPLHYLFGNLYVNFSLLWEPVTQVISSYATTDCSQFWSVFLAKLKGEENIKMVDEPNFECEILESLSGKILSMKDKIDYDNYKLLLWKCMGQIVSYCEVKNRDYVGLFIDFVEGNFFKSNSEDAKSCSVKKREQPKETQAPEVAVEKADQKDSEEPENKNEEEGDDEAKEEDEDSKLQLGRIERVKLLLAMLQVFGKFTNVRSLYREPEILRIYLDLLSSKNSEIQKAALHCLYTYRHKYLTPYKEQLDNIVDEKNLKNELARFQISVGEGIEAVVQEEHREGLIPVLMRILHSKMSQRVGMRTGGKTGGLVRRKTILRFLAGVKEEEMMVFVRMAFKPFQNYLPILKLDEASYAAGEVDLQQMVQDIFKNINLENVVPPKRLSSAVNLLAVIIEQFGGKMTEKLLPHLFAILICILAQVAGILLKSSEVHSGYLTSLRNVRNNCINVLARFFAHFENYDWTSSEINALFQVAVFPWLNKLPVEGIHSPTPLLKMFAAWSHNPRYYPLFVKLDEDRKMTPLDSVIRLLLGLKTHKSVLQMILDMVEKMLTLQDFEKEDPDQLMEVDEFKPKSLMPTVTNKLQVKKNDSINYGSAILLPHVTDILVYIERKLKRQARQGASRTELVILSRISEFVSDSKTCDTLLTLVLPILQRKSGDSEEVVMQLLTTVTNLLKHVDEPKKHLRSIQHLLAQITAAPARKMLMQVLIAVARDDEQMKKNQNLLAELNAYDQRWIDQPDFQRRLDAFSEIDRLIKEEEATLEFGVAVILNCFFFLKTENDLAMRDRSGQCLKSIGLYLAKKYSDNSTDRKYLIEDTILTMVRHGIRKQNDNVKFQSIAFLGHMAMECPEVHPVLRDLHALTNKQDPEVDFFENMQHLQLHRKARALLKFCSVAKTLTKAPNPRTLTQFVLPLASSYLCNEKFSNKNSIVDAAIETIGVVCRLLPWNQYEIVLRFYLDKLRTCVEFQRQVIRIVVAILDSFHFDLSKFKGLDEDILKKRGEESLMQVMAVDDDLKAEEEAEAPKETSTESTSKLAASKPDGLVEPEEVTDEHLDEALNDEAIADANEETEEPSEPTSIQDLTPAMEKMTVLSQYMAKRLVYSISKGLLPQLHKAIAVRTRHEGSHKVNKKRISTDQEEEELMRVPIALAMVKLLQKLPQGMLDSNLRGIFTKICTFLKSRLESVRRTTREILQKIMVTLGPDYLHHLLKEMNALLTRGYQVHVLTFTIHAVLVSLKPYFKPAHMRSNLSSILSVCKIDLFGPTAEEKEIAGIVKNVSEARSTKSYDIFHILGEFINEGKTPLITMR
ncbi:hypothetical protein TSAR_014768 [Trichomalopsis sarcophagae]|uniref:Uncharacterized protein n=1 Tax=Trichomalopsis sarcophagae TaxID=543379 RepID=A0A232FKH6_9HYME|nr:hypothetical protein TSAR_014768 [Trichomalopsis sarcophagae]